MTRRYLDTSIFLRYLTGDDERTARATLTLMLNIEAGRERAVTSPLVVVELVVSLQKRYGVAKEVIQRRVGPIIAMQGLRLAERPILTEALDLFVQHDISFVEAYHVAYMRGQKVDEVYSLDRNLDSVAGMKRLELPKSN